MRETGSTLPAMSRRLRRAALATLIVALAASAGIAATSAQDALDMPVPTDYVVDKAEIIDADSAATLNALLAELERKTTAQFLVVTIDTTNGTPIAEFAKALGNKWGLGQKGKDNGILIVVALRDHDIRIAVGKGLEKVLSGSFCDSVAARDMTPLFRKKEYGKGLVKGTVAIVGKLEEFYKVRLTQVPGRSNADIESSDATGAPSTGAQDAGPAQDDSAVGSRGYEAPAYTPPQPVDRAPFSSYPGGGYSGGPADRLRGLPCNTCLVPVFIIGAILSFFMRGGRRNTWHNDHHTGFWGRGGGSFGGGGGSFGGGGGGSFGGGGGGARW